MTHQPDIVERLRTITKMDAHLFDQYGTTIGEAADEIERLRKALADEKDAVRVLGVFVRAYRSPAEFMVERDARDLEMKRAMRAIKSNPIAAAAIREAEGRDG